MKKLVVAVATMFVAAVLVSTATADTKGGTVVASGFACGILDHNGAVYTTFNSTLTLYDSGKAVLQCSGNNGVGGPGVRHWNFGNTGLSCGMLQFGSTLQWDDQVGYNGNSKLTCTIQDVNAANAAAAGAGLG
jgi:hypothetical protein